MLYARFSLERLEHTVHLKSKTFFALLEVRERERSLQDFLHVGFFIRKSRRVFVTTPAWDAAGGEVLDARRK